jgi:hypothetical protein
MEGQQSCGTKITRFGERNLSHGDIGKVPMLPADHWMWCRAFHFW